MKEKVTVVIPTRSRASTLQHAVMSALNQNYPELEVLVCDNCSDDNTQEVVREIKDERVRYVRTPRRLAMSQNFEFGVSQIKHGWIVVIGDDDGLVANSLDEAVGLLETSGCNALASDTCHYRWPNVRNGKGSSFSVPCFHQSYVKSGQQVLRNVMFGKAGYNDLPLLYTGGIVHSSVVERLGACNGKIFNSAQPDIYSAIAIARVCERFIYTRRPFAIGGTSRNSNGGSIWNKETLEPSGEAKLFHSEDNIPLHPHVPGVWGDKSPPFVPALVYESYLQSSMLGGDIIGVDARQQAQVFRHHPYTEIPLIREWRERFASMHNLHEVDSYRPKFLEQLQWQRSHVARQLINAASRYRFNDSDIDFVRTVYDAGVMAAGLLAVRPNLFKSYAKTANRRLGVILNKSKRIDDATS